MNGEQARLSPDALSAQWLRWSAAGAAFLFPGLAATVEHGGSLALVLLALVCLIGFRGGWRLLDTGERVLLLGMLVFLAAVALSLINADDPGYSLHRLEKLVRLLIFVPAYLTVRYWKIELARPFFYGCLLAGPLLLTVAVFQHSNGTLLRSTGAYHPIVFGDQAVLVIAVLGAALCHAEWRRQVWPLTLAALCCALAATALSGSRGGWVALPLLTALYLWMARHSLHRRIVVALLVSVLSLAAVFACTDNPIKARFAQANSDVAQFQAHTDQNTSLGARFLMWQLAVDIWRESPLVGTGIGDFPYDVHRKIAAGQTRLQQVWPHAHSIYFEYLATTGLVGVLALCGGLLIVPAYLFWNKKADRGFAAMAGLGCILCFAVFGLSEAWTVRSPLLNSYMLCLLVFASGLSPDKTTIIKN